MEGSPLLWLATTQDTVGIRCVGWNVSDPGSKGSGPSRPGQRGRQSGFGGGEGLHYRSIKLSRQGVGGRRSEGLQGPSRAQRDAGQCPAEMGPGHVKAGSHSSTQPAPSFPTRPVLETPMSEMDEDEEWLSAPRPTRHYSLYVWVETIEVNKP